MRGALIWILGLGIGWWQTVSAQPENYTVLFHACGQEEGSFFGKHLLSVGDQNGDGYDDILVDCDIPDEVRLYYGGNPMDTIPDLIIPSPVGVEDFGRLSINCGDINNDGFTDFAIRNVINSESQAVWLFFGGVLLDTIPDLIYIESGNSYGYGEFVSFGDFNGDNIADLSASSTVYSGSIYDKGKVFIYYGGFEVNTIADFSITSVANGFGEMFGNFISIDCDINGDNLNDLLCYSDDQAFTSYFHVWLFQGGNEPDSIPDWSYTTSFTPLFYGQVILRVCSIKDINGDNIDDIALLIKDYNVEEYPIYIFYGGEIISSTPDLIIDGSASINSVIKSAGDINNDGISDLIVWDYWVRIFFGGEEIGPNPDLYYFVGLSEIGDAGYAGDVNGDGVDDFMFYANTDILNQGQVFIYGDTTLSAVRPRLSIMPNNDFILYSNYPNPFNSSTTIPFHTNSKLVEIRIYNILGEIVHSHQDIYPINYMAKYIWGGKDNYGRDLPSGMYIIEASNVSNRKIILSQILK